MCHIYGHICCIYTYIYVVIFHIDVGFPGGSDNKKSAQNAGDPGFDHWVGKIPWRKEWLENCETCTWKGIRDSEVFLVVAPFAKMGIIKT